MAATLSVFLFTACEKESDSPTPNSPSKASKFDKFKSLAFSDANGSGPSSSGVSGSNINFTQAGASNNDFVSPSAGGAAFTNPQSTGSSFIVPNSFQAGGGTIQFGNKSLNVAFGLCASTDIFGESGVEEGADFDAFIGIAGENLSFDGLVGGDLEDAGVELILYVFSFNGGTAIGDLEDFDSDNPRAAFVMAFELDGGDLGQEFGEGLYFGTSGSVSFGGSNVAVTNVNMVELTEDDELGDSSKKLSAALTCVSFESLGIDLD
ncbi:MAG: hypothetical protein CMP59_07315 [Flavobacteriales bacterium]|nr:hypothetical protein [Flavobacteriales bacterium]